MCRDPRPRRRHDLPGADDGAEPAADDRRPGGGDGADPRRRRPRRGARHRRARRWSGSGCRAALFPLTRYPHELSGGQRQRVGIAMAIALRPKLLIADEPTTALDVTTQARIIALLRQLVDEDGMALMLITHDLAVAADVADRLAIMHRGRVVEAGPTGEVLREMRHPYTRALFAASAHQPPRLPRPGADAAARGRGNGARLSRRGGAACSAPLRPFHAVKRRQLRARTRARASGSSARAAAASRPSAAPSSGSRRCRAAASGSRARR